MCANDCGVDAVIGDNLVFVRAAGIGVQLSSVSMITKCSLATRGGFVILGGTGGNV